MPLPRARGGWEAEDIRADRREGLEEVHAVVREYHEGGRASACRPSLRPIGRPSLACARLSPAPRAAPQVSLDSLKKREKKRADKSKKSGAS